MKIPSRLSMILLLMTVSMLSISTVLGQENNTICSTNSGIPTFAVITNGTEKSLKYYWIDENCNEVEYGTIDPGKTIVQPTYATHPWIVRMADTGTQVGDIIVTQSSEPAVAEVACSIMTDVQLDLTVVNQSQSTAELYWVDNECNETLYATLEAGQSVIQPTYQSHFWVLRDAQTGEILSRTRAAALIAPASS